MPTRPIQSGISGESLVAIEPELFQQVEPGWRHRMSLFTGRALTAAALSGEQRYRAGRMALLAQVVTPGLAAGLDVVLEPEGNVRVEPGYGFTVRGEDVSLTRELVTPLAGLTVIDATTGRLRGGFAKLKEDPDLKGGLFLLLLQPISAKATGAELNTADGPIEVSGDAVASCTRDPEAYAFEDWQIVDGVRLVLAAWPNDLAVLKPPSLDPEGTFRNRLAQQIFTAELGLERDAYLPWQGQGVALGLVSFKEDWSLGFLDRNLVARAGGRGRRSQFILSGAQDPLAPLLDVSCGTVEARLMQFLEQLGGIKDPHDLSAFTSIPPTGVLPAAALDFVSRKSVWFPTSWKVHVMPIHDEEVATALRTQMFAAPLSLTSAEEVSVLLPLPDESFDPEVLVVESLSDEFDAERAKATAERDEVLRHRRYLQDTLNVLQQVLARPAVLIELGLAAEEREVLKAGVYSPPADGSEAFGTKKADDKVVATDIADLRAKAADTFTIHAAGNADVPLIRNDDWLLLEKDGLPAFMATIKARIDKVDDLLNLSFLRTQTDIYRYRTNVLNGNAAGRLITSPIIANIAQRESAVASAQDLEAYVASLSKASKIDRAAGEMLELAPGTLPSPPVAVRDRPINVAIFSSSVAAVAKGGLPSERLSQRPTVTPKDLSGVLTPKERIDSRTIVDRLSSVDLQKRAFVVDDLPSARAEPQEEEVVAQLPLADVPFNLRTLSIAERLKTSPSHEALVYSAANRTGFLERLLAEDLGISVDDLQIIVHEVKQEGDQTKVRPVSFALGKLRTDALERKRAFEGIVGAGLPNNSDEPSVFSAGITTLDHHTLLMRAVEGRLALYRQFLALCATTSARIATYAEAASAALKQLDNAFGEARQNLAFINGLIADELKRIELVNHRRAQILKDVPYLVYLRPRKLDTEANVPAAQLGAADVPSLLPVALASDAPVPPELRELTALLREAPPAWIPATAALLDRLDRPQHFFDLAVSMQARAVTRLLLPTVQSSAETHPGPYGAPLAETFRTQQQSLVALVQARAQFEPAQLATVSWAEQRRALFGLVGFNDLLGADSVHLEIANKIAGVIRDVARVATELYLRIGETLPADRLHWAEFLRGPGRAGTVRQLTALPRWSDQDYSDRQQMQSLVDWLFAQIDNSIPEAVSYISDVVRTAILLASHAPVKDIIAGEVAARTRPAVGGTVPLRTPSPRVGRGMAVMLYQAGELAARAVVDDLQAGQVFARVTEIYGADVVLDQNAQAHFMVGDLAGALTRLR